MPQAMSPPVADELKCSFCQRWLPRERFNRNRARTNRDGRDAVCRSCRATYRRAATPTAKRASRAATRPGYARCPGCGQEFTIDAFPTVARRSRGGRRERLSYCRACARVKARVREARRQGDPERAARRRAQRLARDERNKRRRAEARIERDAWVTARVRRFLADGWTIAALAAAAGLSRPTIARWRDGAMGTGVEPRSEARLIDLIARLAAGETPAKDRRRGKRS